MNPAESPRTEAILFREILRDKAASPPLWGPDELGDVLGHQLQVPLEDDLGSLDPAIPAALRDRALGGHPLVTFGDLLCHPSPPRVLLEGLKQFGKIHRHHDSPAIGSAVATLLYYAAVLLARVRLGDRITAMNDAEIAEGVRWALTQAWVAVDTRTLLREGLEALEAEANSRPS